MQGAARGPPGVAFPRVRQQLLVSLQSQPEPGGRGTAWGQHPQCVLPCWPPGSLSATQGHHQSCHTFISHNFNKHSTSQAPFIHRRASHEGRSASHTVSLGISRCTKTSQALGSQIVGLQVLCLWAPSDPLPGLYPANRKRYLHPTFTAALLTIAKSWNRPRAC